MTPEQFIDLLESLIKKQLQTKMYHLGKIYQIEGDRASVYIDGSTVPTPNVPYNPNIKFNAGEDVWVVYINFDPKDKFILCKRGTEEPDPPSSGEDMQVHGNEWHTTAFETAAGAQEKVDTHADSKSTHGVGSNYIAKTTNPNQWPLWTEIEDKPSEFTPSTHSHDLDEITETEEKKIMTAEEKTKLYGIESGANKYTHPETHSASMITESDTQQFVSGDEKTAWDDADSKKHTHSNKSILDTITQILIDAWDGAVSHVSDSIKHITANERTAWNAKADINDIPTNVSELENDADYVTQEDLGDAGYGDMLKGIYDQNNNGIVDNAEKLGGELPSYYEQIYHIGTSPPANTNLLWIDEGA